MKLCTIRGVEIRGGILLLAAVIIGCVLGRLNEMLQAMAALTLHEMAHVIVAAVFEQRIYAIELQPFGCVARMSDKTLTPHAELCIAVAGPVVNFVIAGAVTLAAGILPKTAFRLDPFLSFNMTLALVNLLPALPLDGGRVLKALLSERMGALRAQKTMAVSGIVCGALLLLAAGLLICLGMTQLTLVMMGLFVLVAAIGELRRLPESRLGAVFRRGDALDDGDAVPIREFAVRPAMRAREALRLLQANRFHVLRVIDYDNHTLGEVDEGQLVLAITRKGMLVTVGEILLFDR